MTIAIAGYPLRGMPPPPSERLTLFIVFSKVVDCDLRQQSVIIVLKSILEGNKQTNGEQESSGDKAAEVA